MPTGHLMSVQSVCLGWHWQPYDYSRTADDTDGAPGKRLPSEIVDLARAVGAAYGPAGAEAAAFTPDAAIVNLYAPVPASACTRTAKSPRTPPSSPPAWDTCIFRLAGVDRRMGPFIELRSGDLLDIGGGSNRRVYHRVPKVFLPTPPEVRLPAGRLSVSLFITGLAFDSAHLQIAARLAVPAASIAAALAGSAVLYKASQRGEIPAGTDRTAPGSDE
jgi:alkylated DNA repair protein (DNA oxidative demethylase)